VVVVAVVPTWEVAVALVVTLLAQLQLKQLHTLLS
jgi:hypothetical protein